MSERELWREITKSALLNYFFLLQNEFKIQEIFKRDIAENSDKGK